MKTALVTGANGFIGSFLVERLLQDGFEVRCFVRRTSDLRFIKDLPVKLCFGALAEPQTLVAPLNGAEFVFHVAAAKHALSEEKYDSVNRQGTLNLLEACKQAGSVKKFVYVSSLAVMGPNPIIEPWTEDSPCNPISFYGKSKLKGELEVKKYQQFFQTAIIRPPAVYGPRDTDLLPLFKAVKLGIKPRFRPEKFISLIYIDDLVEAVYRVSQSDVSGGKTYFACDKEYYSFDAIVDEIAKGLKIRGINIAVPNSLVFAAAFLNEVAARIAGRSALLNLQKSFEIAQRYWLCSPKKIESELGVVSKTNLSEGVKKTVEWYKLNGYL